MNSVLFLFLFSLICNVFSVVVPASCRGRCHSGRVGNCFCNQHCSRYGDCCHDYQRVCTQGISQRRNQSPQETRPSCSGRCGIGRVGNCYCNAQCHRHGDCCHDYAMSCSYASPVPTVSANANITEVVSALWSSDINRVPTSSLILDYQGSTKARSQRDRAPRPLFSHLNESTFNRPTYRRFLNLLDNYDPDVSAVENLTFHERNEIEAFIDAILQTDLMTILREYLTQKGILDPGVHSFKEKLRNLWFDLYRRSSRGVVSSSGFEHVMVGEFRGAKVTGFHNWIQFYQEEKRGRLNYQGYISKNEPAMVRAKMTWRGKTKEGASFFVGVSPEFDMAVYTLCILLEPNRNCVFSLGGTTVRVKTFDNALVPGIQVATAYLNM